jgi:MFS family permease
LCSLIKCCCSPGWWSRNPQFPILSFIAEGIFFAAVIFAIWQILGLICLIALKPPEQRVEQNDKVSYRSIISNKAFLLYLVPWLMFSLINDLTKQLNYDYFVNSGFPEYFTQNYSTLELIISGSIAIIFGILADKKGRKRLALIAFVLLGLGYASIGLFGNLASAWFYIFADGIAWGAFSLLFLFTIWGDIAQGKSSEKYYIIGVLPYLFATMIRFPSNQIINTIYESTVFSFASFFLFAAVLPLAYAPETLSDRIIRDLDINSYVNKALEKVEKENMKREKVS